MVDRIMKYALISNEVCHDTKIHWKGVGREATDFLVLLG